MVGSTGERGPGGGGIYRKKVMGSYPGRRPPEAWGRKVAPRSKFFSGRWRSCKKLGELGKKPSKSQVKTPPNIGACASRIPQILGVIREE